MSESSKIHEKTEHCHSTEINDEPLDPRIQIELERANVATSEINNLETQLDNAQELFQITFTSYKQRLAKLVTTLARYIERARPFYHACQQAAKAQHDTQQAAQEYRHSVEFYHTAQEKLIAVQKQLSRSNENTWHEYVHHAAMKVTKAEQDKRCCEQIHEENFKRYQVYEQQRMALSRSVKRAITKSKPYFDIKRRAEDELKNQKLRIEDVQKAIRQAKTTYRTALNNLEQISEEIHIKRSLREPAVGSEQSNQFIEIPHDELTEFPKLDLSDESSDTELSTPIYSLSINDLPSTSIQQVKTTNCLPPSLTNLAVSNRLSF